MNKMMMGASALVIASMAGAAAAQEWSVRLSGGSVSGFGYVDSDTARHDTILIHRFDSTINARLVADNGITFGASLTLRNTGDDNIDQDGYGASVSGSFGTVLIGRHSGPARTMLPRTPRTTFAGAGRSAGILFDGDYSRDETPARGIGDDRGGTTGFTRKITYLTPRFSGFQAGIAYAPGGDSNLAASNIDSTRPNEGIEVGANYTGTFGDFSLAVGGGYTEMLNDPVGNQTDSGYSFGAEVGFSGFALGATYGVNQLANDIDVEVLAIGARYRTGPWSFGVSYGTNLDGTAAGRNRDGDYGFSVAADYALAPGVIVGAQFEFTEADTSVAGPGGTGTDAYAIGVLMGLSF